MTDNIQLGTRVVWSDKYLAQLVVNRLRYTEQGVVRGLHYETGKPAKVNVKWVTPRSYTQEVTTDLDHFEIYDPEKHGVGCWKRELQALRRMVSDADRDLARAMKTRTELGREIRELQAKYEPYAGPNAASLE